MKTRVTSLLIFIFMVGGCQWLANLTREKSTDLKELETIAKTKPGSKEALAAATDGARISFLESKDYRRALFFYKYLVLYGQNEEVRNDAQKHLAEIYFERLSDYEQAVMEYNRLLQLPHSPEDNVSYRMNVAKAYFYLNKFTQAEAELDLVIRSNPLGTTLFDANLLRANIFLAIRNIDGAIDLFKKLMEKFPQQSKDEHVGLSLAVCFEEKNEFKQARAVLNEIRGFYPRPDFIDLKIQRLEERESQLPGAQGLRK